jgi:predicted acetyltransferase
MISIRDVKGSNTQDRRWIQSVYGEYLDSLSDLNTGLFPVLGEGNPREDEIFANWFANDQSHPLIISKSTEPVGFALVTRARTPAAGATPASFRMSEFFVRKPHRGVGTGRHAATLIFDRFAGEWHIVEYSRHPGSIAFWRRVLTVYCPGKFVERSVNGEVHQRFKSRPAPLR